jgi:hypothetical protein
VLCTQTLTNNTPILANESKHARYALEVVYVLGYVFAQPWNVPASPTVDKLGASYIALGDSVCAFTRHGVASFLLAPYVGVPTILLVRREVTASAGEYMVISTRGLALLSG